MTNLASSITSTIKYWWILSMVGIGLIIFSIYVCLNPLAGYSAISIYFGVTISLNGFFQIVFSLGNQKAYANWIWFFVSGIFNLIIGSILLANLHLVEVSLPLFVGSWLLLSNTTLIGHSFQLKQMRVSKWIWFLIAGIVGMLFAITIIYNPLFGAKAIIIWTVLALALIGIFYIILGLHLKRMLL